MRDLLNNSEQIMLLSAARRSGSNDANTPTVGTAVNLIGEGRKCLVLVSVGTTSTTTVAVTIQQSADNVTYSTLSTLHLHEAEAQVVDLTPTMKYIRASAAFSTTSETGTFMDFGVGVIVYNERYRPSNVA